MTSYRLAQVNSLIKEVFSEILKEEMLLPPDFLITVTRVCVSKDLSHAQVFISVYPKITEEIQKFFEMNIYRLQQLLNKKLKMHPVPKLIIHYDLSEEKAAEIEEVLNKIKD
ncbi:MAG: 30S ribosome-binding factor RbfA [Minisyncoccia bacterium]